DDPEVVPAAGRRLRRQRADQTLRLVRAPEPARRAARRHRGPVRRDLLPQRPHLFRQADPEAGRRVVRESTPPGRLSVLGSRRVVVPPDRSLRADRRPRRDRLPPEGAGTGVSSQNYTFFMRGPEQLAALAGPLLDEFLARDPHVRIWSAACST